MSTSARSSSMIISPSQRPYILAFIAAFCAAMLFAAFTNLAWDDWYITYRASKNLAIGNGLTFTAGERIHSFTSPLGTLLPALINVLIGNVSDDLVLWIFRFLNAAVLGSAAVVVLATATRMNMGHWAKIVVLGMMILDAKILANSINGMETALLVFFVALSVYSFTLPPGRRAVIFLGISWAGLMWTRPDGFIYVAGLCAGFFLFPQNEPGKNRTALVKNWFFASLLMTLLYGPWLVWAWSYYGSIVPHTVIAKGFSISSASDGTVLSLLGRAARSAFDFILARPAPFRAIFIPPYGINFGGWPAPLVLAGRLLAWIGAFAWVLPILGPHARALSVATCVGQAYLSLGMEYAFPWYFAPVTLLTAFVFALSIDQCLLAAATRTDRFGAYRSTGLKIAATSAVAVTAVVTISAAAQLRSFQTIIYEGNYKPVGLWLKENAKTPRDTVFLEPLGYIGFFSNLKMYDYPGLSSEEMINARKALPVRNLGDRAIFAELIPALKPDWLVLRPSEIDQIDEKSPTLLHGDYQSVRRFDVSREVAEKRFLPGRPWFELDQTFVIFRREQT